MNTDSHNLASVAGISRHFYMDSEDTVRNLKLKNKHAVSISPPILRSITGQSFLVGDSHSPGRQIFKAINIRNSLHIHSFCNRFLGRFPFNGLYRSDPNYFLCINGKIWSMFLKYLAKMDLILMLSKFSGQISQKPKCFVFYSTI